MMNGVLGDLISTKARHRGIQGFVVDGLIRDLPDIQALEDFPVFARGVSPIGPLHRGPGEINHPISAGGIVVNPGDVIVGDRNGVVVVPRGIADDLLDRLRTRAAVEADYTAAVAARRLRQRLGRPSPGGERRRAPPARRGPLSAMLLRDDERARGPRDEPNPPAVLLGGSANAVSVARSLCAAGVPVVALGHAGSPVRHSRACATFVDLGREDGVQERWLRWLEDGPRGAVLLPCDDDSLELVVTRRRELTALGYRLVEADDAVARDMLDKNRTYELARGLGIPAPRTVTVRTMADVDAAAGDLEYPCALKPVHSHRFQRRTGTGVKAFVVHDAGELRERFAYAQERGVEMLVTEIILGSDDRIFGFHTYLDEDGEPLFGLTKRKLRQHPVGFGLGSYHETVHDAEVAQLGLRLPAGRRAARAGERRVQARRARRRLKLIECNHRFTAPNEQLRIAGIDVALLVYNRILGRPLPAVGEPRAGVRLWHPGQDFRSFLELRRRGDLTTAGWLRSVARPQHLPLFRWDDPQPSLALQATRARRVWDKRLGRSAGATPSLDAGPVRAHRAEEALAAVAPGGHGR